MILPHRYQLWAWSFVVLLLGLAGWQDLSLFWLWVGLGVWLLWVFISAIVLLFEQSQFEVMREFGEVQQSGQSFFVQLHVKSGMCRQIEVSLFDHYPQQAQTKAMPHQFVLNVNEQVTLDYSLSIPQRGRFSFVGVQLRYPDRFKMWQRDVFVSIESHVRVYPRFDYQHTESFAGIQTPQLGQVHPLRSRSGNGDFSHLRDYISGDAINRIDHKASARLGNWLVREYDFEHEQPVLLMLDASRRMQAQYQQKSLFDELLVAATQLARTVLKEGDEVGIQIFSDAPQRYLPCGRRSGQYRRVVETLFDQKTVATPPNYAAAVHEAYRYERKRSLIILLTVLENGDDAALKPLLRLLRRRHHVMLVNIRPPYLDVDMPVLSVAEALNNAARDVYANAFYEMEAQLRKEKLIFVSSTISKLRPQLLNAYLAYKAELRS